MSEMKSKKNLVILHLESLNNLFYNQIRDDVLPNISDLMGISMRLKKFFSTATSSIMAMTDFLYGNDLELDHCTSMDYLSDPSRFSTSLIDILKNAGYNTIGTGFPVTWRDYLNHQKIWSLNEDFLWFSEYDSFLNKIDQTIAKGDSPFALYVWDTTSHLSYSDSRKVMGKNSFEKWKFGYRNIDETVGRVVEMLKKRNLLEDTIIVGFGDHGDDFWTHGINGGFCHVIEPYTNLIHTPAFIYDFKIGNCNNNDLVSLVDLKKTILYLLNIDYDKGTEQKGINIFNEKRNYVTSRNLFLNQETTVSSIVINKSFSVSNENYHLIVSNKGLEMYAYEIDPTNHCNLLNFFDMDSEGKLIFFNRGAIHPHFKKFMVKNQIDDIMSNFSELVSFLKTELTQNYKIVKYNNTNRLSDESFLKINRKNENLFG